MQISENGQVRRRGAFWLAVMVILLLIGAWWLGSVSQPLARVGSALDTAQGVVDSAAGLPSVPFDTT
jgi:hypothetical protein